jgi:stage IV sporulation protein FB
MKNRTGVSVSGGAVLLLAALWFFTGPDTFFALLTAAFFHEAGHICALRLSGCRVRMIRADAAGAELTADGGLGRRQELFALAAGPILGLVFALAAARLGTAFHSAFLLRSAGISAVLSAFNLLPALPLDGGRIAAALWDNARACAALSFLSALVILCLGLVLLAKGMGAGLFIAGIWLMLGQAVL